MEKNCIFFLKKIISFLIKRKVITVNTFQDYIRFSSGEHILYALPKKSMLDLLILQIECEKLGLPNPFDKICIKNIRISRCIFSCNQKIKKPFLEKQFIKIKKLLNLYRLYQSYNIKIIFVFISSRFPHEKNVVFNKIKILKIIKKIFSFIFFSKNIIVYLSNPISLYYVTSKYKSNNFIIKIFTKFTNIYFFRIKIAFLGCKKLKYKKFLKLILTSEEIEHFIKKSVKNKKFKIKKLKKNIINLINEIFSSISYKTIKLADKIVHCLYKKIYNGLYIYNIKKIKKLSINGYKIIYLPCHRSHMDYILISYILYRNGLTLPYIAAGNNLNFFPVGYILRKLGAFFIRRTFNKKRLHSIIFKKYFNLLLNSRCPIEYFIEGGRSRTGKLLQPKTGTLNLTIKMMLCNKQLISLVPIYIGYEKMIEIKTYIRELYGYNRKKENIWNIIKFIFNIKNFGKSYINFGDPIFLSSFFSIKENNKNVNLKFMFNNSNYFYNIVDKISRMIMIRINNSVVINPINVFAIILLYSHKCSLKKNELLLQISFYIDLLKNVPYSENIKIPIIEPERILKSVLQIYKIKSNNQNHVSPTFYLSYKQSEDLFYYSNNIKHVFIFPSLIANIIYICPGIHKKKLIKYIILLYPFIKEEFFIEYNKNKSIEFVSKLIHEMIELKLIIKKTSFLYSIKTNIQSLIILANKSKIILQKYAIVFFLLKYKNIQDTNILEKYSILKIKTLLEIKKRNSLELLDKSTFKTLIKVLKSERYINKYSKINKNKVKDFWKILQKTIPFNILYKVKS